jgi:hypothetical protein
MTITALRAGPGLGATAIAIVCSPLPLAGTPVTHPGTSLVVQVHGEFVETVSVTCPPAAGNDDVPALIE